METRTWDEPPAIRKRKGSGAVNWAAYRTETASDPPPTSNNGLVYLCADIDYPIENQASRKRRTLARFKRKFFARKRKAFF
jgi:hypothetical protein